MVRICDYYFRYQKIVSAHLGPSKVQNCDLKRDSIKQGINYNLPPKTENRFVNNKYINRYIFFKIKEIFEEITKKMMKLMKSL